MSFIKEFKEFALKGNVIDLAVAVIIGGAFGVIVSSFVTDIVTPLILTPALEAAPVKDLKDLTLIDDESMDRLEHMLKLQTELQIRYTGDHPALLQGDAQKDYIRTMVLACTDELHEALREIPWKPWSKRTEWTNDEQDRFKDELVDAWHFMMNLMLAVDMNAEELFKRYLRKNGINHDREDNGYISPTG